MTKYATLNQNGEIDVVYLNNPGNISGLLEIDDNVFSGFVSDGVGGFKAPPAPTPSLEERITEIDLHYKPKLDALTERLQIILLADGANMEIKLADLRSRYVTVTNEYSAALDALFLEE